MTQLSNSNNLTGFLVINLLCRFRNSDWSIIKLGCHSMNTFYYSDSIYCYINKYVSYALLYFSNFLLSSQFHYNTFIQTTF